MDGTNLSLTPGHFKAALRIVSSTLEQRLNQTAQTSLANGNSYTNMSILASQTTPLSMDLT
jgi:hypothetical protein